MTFSGRQTTDISVPSLNVLKSSGKNNSDKP